MAANPETAVAVIEQDTEQGVVEWNLDAFPTNAYNRLLPTQTLSIPTDLLRPVVQVVQLNPDTNAGDVYHSADMPNGQAAPTKVGLRKLATAAGISFVDEQRTDDGSDPDVIEVTCHAEMLLPTGQRIRATGMKRVDLNAQVWSSPQHRGKYKSFFLEHVSSRAQNRAIRALLSLKGSYPTEVYQRPFAVVSYAPNMANPEIRTRMIELMAGAAPSVFGPANRKELAAGPINVTPAPDEDPAPTTPTVLPGEKLAAAAQPSGTPEEPSWMAQADPAPAPVVSIGQRLLAGIRASGEAGGLNGAATKPQLAKLRELFTAAGIAGAATTAGLKAVWPDVDVEHITANQANAIIVGCESFAGDAAAMAAAWTELAG